MKTVEKPIEYSAEEIKAQLNERRPLPIGRAEFEVWTERIMSGAMVTAEKESQIFILASMILQLGPTESHKEDGYFIHGLRKAAVNQTADTIFRELKLAQQERWDAENKKQEAEKVTDAEFKALNT